MRFICRFLIIFVFFRFFLLFINTKKYLVVITHFSRINFPESKDEILPIVFGLASAFGAIIFGKLGDITVRIFF